MPTDKAMKQKAHDVARIPALDGEEQAFALAAYKQCDCAMSRYELTTILSARSHEV